MLLFIKKLNFHPSFYILLFSFFITGYYANAIVFTTLIIVHEFGHFITATILKVNVKEIIIYPYGGITKLESIINLDIYKELLIATSGIIMQYSFYKIILFLYKYHYIREYIFNLYTLYNSRIIFFNLLPIYPLDGEKILKLLLELIFPFKISNYLIILISIITTSIMIYLNIYIINYSNIMTFIILLTYLYKYYINLDNIYNRFILERYLYNIKYQKNKFINNIKYMYKNKYHYIRYQDRYIEEKEYLNLKFKK